MPRKPRRQAEEQLPDLCGRQAARFPAWWSEVSPEELQAAHDRAKCLRAKGHGAVIWGSSTQGEIFNEQ